MEGNNTTQNSISMLKKSKQYQTGMKKPKQTN